MSQLPMLIDLIPDRKLLNSNFDGYKLSLEGLPQVKLEFDIQVDRVLADGNQYSYLHAKLYGLHNHLVKDPENDDVAYFVDKQWNIQKVSVNSFSFTLYNIVTVWQIPYYETRNVGSCNVSFRFMSSNLAAIANGTGTLHIVNTGTRANDDQWDVVFSDEVIGPGKYFVISDAVYLEASDTINLLLYCIEREASTDHFYSAIYWVVLSKKDNSWGQTSLKQLKCSGEVQYLYFERNCTSLYVVGSSETKFILDSDNPIIEKTDVIIPPETIYNWTQNKENISLSFKTLEEPSKGKVFVQTTTTEISVKYDNKILLAGKLYNKIDADLTTWSIENNKLQVNMHKIEEHLMWPELVFGDRSGEYIPDPDLVNEVHQRLAHLCSDSEVSPQAGTTFNSQQIEECDFNSDKIYVFERISCENHKTTHKVNLGSHEVLVTVDLDDSLPPTIGIRHDVDVCLWQPEFNGEKFDLTHKETLLALGYIQASKQQKKYLVCPPDLRFSAICESSSHLFLYRQKIVIKSAMKNRRTGAKVGSIAKQQLVNLPNEEILGVQALKNALLILGDDYIIAIKI